MKLTANAPTMQYIRKLEAENKQLLQIIKDFEELPIAQHGIELDKKLRIAIDAIEEAIRFPEYCVNETLLEEALNKIK